MLIIFPLITMPYISRVIGAEGIGVYTYTYTIAGYFVLVGMLGIANYGSRKIAQVREDKQKLSEEFWSIYGLQFISSVVVTSIYIVYTMFMTNVSREISIVQTIYVLTGMFDISWFFHGMEEFKKITIKNIIVKILAIIAIFVFVNSKDDLLIYTVIMSVAFLLGRIVIWTFLHKKIYFVVPKWKMIKQHFKPCVILLIPLLAHGIYRVIDKIMLGNMVNISEVGYYEYAEKIIRIPETLTESLSIVMLPHMSNLLANGNKEIGKQYVSKTMKFGMFMAVPTSIVLICTADKFMPIFLGNEFSDAVIILKILAASLPLFVWADIIKSQFMIPNEMDKQYTKTAIMGIILNIILNAILIPKYAGMGAALATLISELVVVIKQSMGVKKELELKQYLRYVIEFLIPSCIMGAILILISLLIKEELTALILQMIVTILMYGIFYRLFGLKYNNKQ